MFTSQESGLPLFSVVAWWSNTNQAQKKASLRVPREAVGLPYRKHKERRNAVAFSSARYRPVEISYVSLGDRFAVVANCYGDEAVAPSYVRFTELLSSSFHCSVLRTLK